MDLSADIARWIKGKVEETGNRGVVVGMSGGVDSATVAVLVKKAMGEKMLGVIMPCHSNPEDAELAQEVASIFAIPTQRVDLGPLFDAFIRQLPEGSEVAHGNLKPRLRMITLYYFANSLGYLVAGTGNKSELLVGYFTKYGDGGVDILPLGGLLKTQVRQLARELGIPDKVVDRVPTAGLWEGQTDEGEMGISYAQLDRIIEASEKGGFSGLDPRAVEIFQGMNERSSHKRKLPEIFKIGAGNG
ncbi:MAG: NAD+ synthase [Chloroflexi bacterium]|nr:NAD+ synthase [Chloroflexota bacterium]